MHRDVLDYFNRGDQDARSEQERQAVRHTDDPSEPGRAVLTSYETVYAQGWPEQPGLFMLRNEFPAQIMFGGESYASVLHGYWALSAADASGSAVIRNAASGRDAHELGGCPGPPLHGLSDSPFRRDVPDGRGRNWMGRLLELTRSELVAQQALRP